MERPFLLRALRLLPAKISDADIGSSSEKEYYGAQEHPSAHSDGYGRSQPDRWQQKFHKA